MSLAFSSPLSDLLIFGMVGYILMKYDMVFGIWYSMVKFYIGLCSLVCYDMVKTADIVYKCYNGKFGASKYFAMDWISIS